VTCETSDGTGYGNGATVDVVLARYPLVLGELTSAHYAEALRELTLLVSAGEAPVGSVPERVVTLVGDLTELRELTTGFDSEKAVALASGETVRDMRFAMSPEMVVMSSQLGRLLDEVDDYCRDEKVLTLAPDPSYVAYRRWYVDELVAQAAGRTPTPWAGSTP
jgi:hypothetical protein